jgi:SAM-dependent methyltransferase
VGEGRTAAGDSRRDRGYCNRDPPGEWRRRLAVLAPRLPVATNNQHHAGATRDAAFFERFYGQCADDPWGYAAAPLERAKYERTLEVCSPTADTSTLELACATGIFTAMLAPLCGTVLAVDISEVAVKRARDRVAAFPRVRCERRTIPHELPEVIFDLIVCSDFLTYLAEEDIRATAGYMRAHTADGGAVVIVNNRRAITTEPERITELVEQELPAFRLTRAEELERHRIARYERATVKH